MYGFIKEIFVEKGESVWGGKALLSIKKGRYIVTVRSRNTGVIKEIHVKEGERFIKNKLLIEIDLDRNQTGDQIEKESGGGKGKGKEKVNESESERKVKETPSKRFKSTEGDGDQVDQKMKKIVAKQSGKVIGIMVKKGDQVLQGSRLFDVNQGGRSLYIRSRNRGIIKEIHVKEGERFKENDLLAELI